MDFNSYIFILIFLPITFIMYVSIRHTNNYTLLQLLLLASSIIFYAYSQKQLILFLIFSCSINYLGHRLIIYFSNTNVYITKFILFSGIFLNVFSLGYCKYTNLAVSFIDIVFGANLSLINLIIPLGISFITFQQIAFLIDTYNNPQKDISPLEYGIFISFFPHISSGPILVQSQFLPELRKKYDGLNWENISKGILLFSIGLSKKIILADTLGKAVNSGYSNLEALNTVSSIYITLAFTLQLYYDFSGYCDMAMGIAKLFNIELPINFNSPYKAITISDFWKRWHISLTYFFTKYIYIPLGGNRKGTHRTYINIMIIFLISGLWHGANYTFVLWGILHGIAMALTRMFSNSLSKIPALISRIVTFIFLNITWIIFRAPSLHTFINVIKAFFIPQGNLLIEISSNFLKIGLLDLSRINLSSDTKSWIFLFIALFIVLLPPNSNELAEKCTWRFPSVIITLLLLLFCIFSITGTTTYLYTMF